MSIKLLNELRQRKVGSASARSVLKSLCFFMNDETGRCSPSLNLLVQDTEMTLKTILSSFKKLESMGVVKRIESGYRKVNHYSIDLDVLPLNESAYRYEVTSIIDNPATSKNYSSTTGKTTTSNLTTGKTTTSNFSQNLEKRPVDLLVNLPVRKEIKEIEKKNINTYSSLSENLLQPTTSKIEQVEENSTIPNSEKVQNFEAGELNLFEEPKQSKQIEEEKKSLPVAEQKQQLPNSKQSNEGKKNKKAQSPTLLGYNFENPAPAECSEEVWQEFLQYRKERKEKLSQRSISMLLTETKKAKATLEKCLIKLMESNWRGFKAAYVQNDEDFKPEPEEFYRWGGKPLIRTPEEVAQILDEPYEFPEIEVMERNAEPSAKEVQKQKEAEIPNNSHLSNLGGNQS